MSKSATKGRPNGPREAAPPADPCEARAFAIVAHSSYFAGAQGMAERHDLPEESHAGSSMDIGDHMKTWLAFWAATKWSVVGLAVLGLLLLLFRTNDGV